MHQAMSKHQDTIYKGVKYQDQWTLDMAVMVPAWSQVSISINHKPQTSHMLYGTGEYNDTRETHRAVSYI